MRTLKAATLAFFFVTVVSTSPVSAGYMTCVNSRNVDECGGLAGTVVPGCVALEQLSGLTCSAAASKFGLSYTEVSDEEMLLGVIGDADVSYQQEVWDATDGVIPDDCDIRWPESCLPLSTATSTSQVAAGVTPGPSPWGSPQNLKLADEEGRTCASEAGDASLLGKSYRYVPKNHIQGQYKFVVWSQWHNAHRTDSSDKLKFVGQSMTSKIAEAGDADPLGTITLGAGTTLSINLSAYGFGFGASWQAGGNRVVGEIRDSFHKNYGIWSGDSTTAQAIRGASWWKLPKGEQAEFQGYCVAYAR